MVTEWKQKADGQRKTPKTSDINILSCPNAKNAAKIQFGKVQRDAILTNTII